MTDLRDYKHIHCVGIGGIGLSAIAQILKQRGYKVSGSDIKDSPMLQQLREQGIDVYIGHSADNLGDTDLLVYSAAVNLENPELAYCFNHGINMISRAEALGGLMADYDISVAVSGTHGKTTTTSMFSLILKNAQLSPTILVGGILDQLGGKNVSVGDSEYFVTEACEYMDSFLSLRPKIEIILNIDSDHLDYFKNIEHIAGSFGKFAGYIPKDGMLVAYDANPFVKAIADKADCRVVSFGCTSGSTYCAENISFGDNGCPSYDLYIRGNCAGRICLGIPGEHNIFNSLAAAAASMELGVDFETVRSTLQDFKGTHRRFDIVGKTAKGATVIDDYAHHPTEIRATLSAASKMHGDKIWCLFQPHTYTRTIALFDEFTDAFEDADHLLLAEIFAAREKNIYKLSSEKLKDAILEKHPQYDCRFIPSFDEMAKTVLSEAGPNDIIITMGAGDICNLDLMLENR